MRKKGIVLILSCLIVITVSGCGMEKAGKDSKENTGIENKLEEADIDSLKESEKIEIAKGLFDEYINENKIELIESKEDSSKKEEVVTFTKYKIKDVEIYDMKDLNNNEKEKNGFIAGISYDIKYTDESNRWIAGNGEIKKNNWCVNKVEIVNIEKVNGKYIISSMGTG